jgi:hypothetical protein
VLCGLKRWDDPHVVAPAPPNPLRWQLDEQVELMPVNLRNPYARKLVDLFRGGITTAYQRIALVSE